MKYEIRFWFDFGGFCLWAMNDKTRERYNYAIEPHELKISAELESKLKELQEEYGTYLDMSNPMTPTSWTKEKKDLFLEKSLEICQELEVELGSSFKIINDVNKNIS